MLCNNFTLIKRYSNYTTCHGEEVGVVIVTHLSYFMSLLVHQACTRDEDDALAIPSVYCHLALYQPNLN